MLKYRNLLLPLALLALALPSRADDSAASVSTGGIILTREARITMAKEVLVISLAKITVDYDFRNDTDQNITTEVAFPVPPYNAGEDFTASGMRPFDDFKLWVEGKPEKYEVESKAMLNGHDYTSLLTKLGVDVPSLGHYVSGDTLIVHDYDKLSKVNKEQLIRLGLIDADGNGPAGPRPNVEPLWTVEKKYHWLQTFPAHSITRIRHEYSPAFGFEYINANLLSKQGQDAAMAEALAIQQKDKTYDESGYIKSEIAILQSACIDPSLQRRLLAVVTNNNTIPLKNIAGDAMPTEWVDFILTTANSWKTPIEDFELIVDKSVAPNWVNKPQYVSFCWDGPVKKLDATHFQATATNFVPKQELHILFLSANKPTPEK